MKTYEVLEKALDLIRDEKDWWAGPGTHTSTWESRCALMALGDVDGNTWRAPSLCARELLEAIAHTELTHFNDSHTHAEVVELFQRAIQAEKAKDAAPLPETVEPGRTPALEAMYA